MPPPPRAGGLGRVRGFTLTKLLGKGTFGTVYQATRDTDGKNYAIKKVDTRRMGAKDRAEAVNEIRVLASVAGAHIITFFEAFVESDVLYIVTEFATSGDLFGYLKEARKRGPLREEVVWSLFIQMLLGLKSLHDRNILHRDLKGANIFMCSRDFIKLGDFGVSKVLKSEQALARTQVGTPYYVAPEVWRNRSYNAKCDMWSLGCLLYELCTYRPPFQAESMDGLARKIMRGAYEPIPPGYSKELQTVIARLLVVEPARRAAVDDILLMRPVVQRMDAVLSLSQEASPSAPVDLVKTIQVPHRFNDLTKHLPPSRYDVAASAEPPSDPTRARALPPVPVHSADSVGRSAARSPQNPLAEPTKRNAAAAVAAASKEQIPPQTAEQERLRRMYIEQQKKLYAQHEAAQRKAAARRPGSGVPLLPQLAAAAKRPGAAGPPPSASAAAAQQLAQPYSQRMPPLASPASAAYSRPASGARIPPLAGKQGALPPSSPSSQIRVVYHNPHAYQPIASKVSIFRANSQASIASIYNPITHRQQQYGQPTGQPQHYQSRLARLHLPSQQQPSRLPHRVAGIQRRVY
mmetsp:Transcript_41070/g.136086  ORF Transcript_41070/g.136086 Transcript_41070/m.136086 type:complete len:577 (+) Transcript_41070:83-1813(+)